jgi:hypothetical protein
LWASEVICDSEAHFVREVLPVGEVAVKATPPRALRIASPRKHIFITAKKQQQKRADT